MRKGLKVFGIVLGVALVGAAIFYGPTVYDFWKAGAFDKPLDKEQYRGGSRENLQAMYRALMATHDSDGVFPEAGWMDAIKPRMATQLDKGWEQKYVSPVFRGQKDKFGYALNSAVAGKYKDDIKDPEKTLLVFDSSDTSWNASGEPAKLLPKPERPGGNTGVTVDGKIVRVDEDGTLKPLE